MDAGETQATTNYEYQMTVQRTNGNRFYRLKNR
jgi:hypothetical protein